ncbi:MAG: ATP-dependent DNA helicase [Pedobacter sp.]|nr:ATP-dependent DNA helicase [Pedobacter sp.]
MSFRIAVRELCEFTAKTGDLDLRFTPSPTAQEGMEGHRMVASRRGSDYDAELSLNAEYGPLSLRGRCDGFDAARGRLEEVKTFRGDLSRLPDNQRALHWAQAKLYGAMICAQQERSELEVALVYFDIGTQKETVLAENFQATELQAFFREHCERFLHWAEQELAHRQARDAALGTLRFPFADFRHGQRLLAEGVYRAARDGKVLLAQAPTGIGKTLGTLFPLLKACPVQEIDRVFFLTAKTPGRALALEAAQRLKASDTDLSLRVLELTARDKACVHPDKECHGESCPLAQGFYDRLPAARAEAVASAFLDQATLACIAEQHAVCPYYLSQELARWSDIVVGDYNYFFDGSALLYSLTQRREWKVALLVDEAHNLVDRAREMYSAELQPARLAALRKLLPTTLKRPLGRFQKIWDELHEGKINPLDPEAPAPEYQCRDELPEAFTQALQQTLVKIADWQGKHPQDVIPELQQFYFEALHFHQLLELIGPHSFIDLLNPQKSPRSLRLHNVIPAPHLQARIAACHSLTLFSATLTPPQLHRQLLGLPESTQWLDVPSPFAATQLAVHLVDNISTRYQHREGSLGPMADLMAAQYRQKPGNYLAFFSSHDYLQRALITLRERHPDIPLRKQSRSMNEDARKAFLQGFGEETEGIAFAVLGGAFSEGIDLPGRRLIGAFVATLGLPQVNAMNEKIRECLEQHFQSGYDYTYLYPGLQKVVQAAGRVIRTTQDEGVLYLIDDRFTQAHVRALLPEWWQPLRFNTIKQRAVSV